MSVPTGFGNYPPGVTDNDPHFDSYEDEADDDYEPYEVVCARCGEVGTSETFHVEEGDEWECPTCYERCEAEAASQSHQGDKS